MKGSKSLFYSSIIFSSFYLIFAEITKPDLSEYGVDISYPIHHYMDGNVTPYFKKRYESLMEGCYKYYSQRECDATERARLEMNLAQPKTEHNYTEVGFKKIRLPKAAWEPLIQFYETHKNDMHLEAWNRGYTYVNTWDSPSYMISFEDSSFRDGMQAKQLLWSLCQPVIEEWVGRKVEPTSLYGIRVYKDKAILATHVDRLPLVSSAIINVAQDTNEPWPVEIYDHNGKAYNVTMEPGDMVMYESHTVLHGRPFPLNGSFYANVFVHYKPLDHDENNRRDHEAQNNQNNNILKRSGSLLTAMKERYQRISGHEQHNHDQDAIDKHLQDIDSEAEDRIAAMEAAAAAAALPRDEGYKFNPNDDAATALRLAAKNGDLKTVEFLVGQNVGNIDLINQADENGWQPLHEAVRGGYLEVVKYLIELGADMGGMTSNDQTPLSVGIEFLPPNHAILEYLQSIGAPE
mmetsp:Transcript_28509/g.39256  ORF Transcript_28509/g.39256 Transcript_28509/m.39256 type:complete len:462 (+) Transcript_28509:45-1430(+)